METLSVATLGGVLPGILPRPVLYLLAIGGLAYLFRRQLRRVFR